MLAIIAMLSDIPLYVFNLVEQVTGMDMSSVSKMLSDAFSSVLDLIG